MNRIEYEIPNLDGMTTEELLEWVKALGHGARPDIFKNGKGSIRATIELRNYGWNKLTAMKLRLTGNIETAMQYEAICESIYSRLPEWARW
jgi:hypothetical protein